MVVSVSRRCDIPRFQFGWFMERIYEGFVDVTNPYNSSQIKRVSLVPAKECNTPDDGVEAFVFWTRDPRRILVNADELTKRGFPFYVMVTVTGYPAALEPYAPPAPEVLTAMKELARIIGAERVIWRYDPILLSSITDEDFHRANFNSLAQNLAGSVRRVIISIYDEYREARMRLFELERKGKLRMPDSSGDLSGLLADLAKSAEAAGMEIQSCAEKEDFSSLRIKQGACIDAALINKLFGFEFSGKDKNQRSHCLCCKSVDIGVYKTCEAKCVYCYAC
jgi:DNA repair photolyase